MIVFLDIGSTLIEGPNAGPAKRIAEALALGPEAMPKLERLLFRTPARDAEELGERISVELGTDRAIAVKACVDLWRAQMEEAFVLPGAREAIERLRSAGIRRAYLSNIWAPFYECFQREFADEALCPQFVSFRAGLMKPDPEFFLSALRSVDAAPQEAVMVGDTYLNDILPALNLGMRTVWVLHRPAKERRALVQVLNGEAPKPDVTIHSIGDLCVEHLWKS